MKFLVFVLLLCSFPILSYAKEVPLSGCELDAGCLKEHYETFYQEYKLERVIDGDTIVASGVRIRMWGIDTPEKGEDYFLVAKMLLEGLLKDGVLTCKFIEEDRYGRSVMHCLIDGLDVGSLLVRAGVARDFSRYSGDYYQFEEDAARSEGIGIWGE